VPNIQFYGVREDLVELLDLAVELGCELYEKYSSYDAELRRFATVDEVVAGCDLGHDPYGRGGETMLALWSPAMRARPRIERIELRVRGASWRETVNGWGLIHLDLGGIHERTITESALGHNSEARAWKWADVAYEDLGSPGDWDWREVGRLARKLAYHVRRRRAVAKTEPPVVHYVLPAAHRLCEAEGYVLVNGARRPVSYG
jgi:hypothetical protein